MLPLSNLDQPDVAIKDVRIRTPWDGVQSLFAQIQMSLVCIAEIEAGLAKGRRNSSKHPSSNRLRKPKLLRKQQADVFQFLVLSFQGNTHPPRFSG